MPSEWGMFYVCTHIHTNTYYIHMYIFFVYFTYIYLHMFTYIFTYFYIYIYIYIYLHFSLHVHIHIYIYIYITCIYIYIYIHIYLFTFKYIHTHTCETYAISTYTFCISFLNLFSYIFKKNFHLRLPKHLGNWMRSIGQTHYSWGWISWSKNRHCRIKNRWNPFSHPKRCFFWIIQQEIHETLRISEQWKKSSCVLYCR